MARTVDRMAVILPFEQRLYEERGISAEFVGHPLVVDHLLDDPLPQESRVGVGLLPGSREQEVRRILPVLLDAAAWIRDSGANEMFVVARSPGVSRGLYERLVERCDVEVVVSEDPAAVMRSSRVLLVASGTATLQGALAETPIVIVYKASPLNYLVAQKLLTIDNIGLINVILGDRVAPEFIQGQATPGAIAECALGLLLDESRREEMLSKFRSARGMLSGGGGCERVAELAAELISA